MMNVITFKLWLNVWITVVSLSNVKTMITWQAKWKFHPIYLLTLLNVKYSIHTLVTYLRFSGCHVLICVEGMLLQLENAFTVCSEVCTTTGLWHNKSRHDVECYVLPESSNPLQADFHTVWKWVALKAGNNNLKHDRMLSETASAGEIRASPVWKETGRSNQRVKG